MQNFEAARKKLQERHLELARKFEEDDKLKIQQLVKIDALI